MRSNGVRSIVRWAVFGALLAVSVAAEEVYVRRPIAYAHNLPREQAEKREKISVEGVVTGVPFNAGFTIQDATDGIFVWNSQWHNVVRVGEKVRVWGAAVRGAFAPIVLGERLEVLGSAPPPVPKRILAHQLVGGSLDNNFVEAIGVAREAVRVTYNGEEVTMLTLDMQPGLVKVSIKNSHVDPQIFVDCTIRAVGVDSIEYNNRQQGMGMQVNVNADSDITVLTRPSSGANNAQRSNVGGILRFDRKIDWSHRVQVGGTVTMQRPRQFIVVQDGDQGIRVESRSKAVYAVGSVVDVVGFVGKGEYSPVLESALIVDTGKTAPVIPTIRRVADLSDGADDWRVVQTDATLVEAIRNDRNFLLILTDHGREFSAELPVADAAGKFLLDLKKGSTLRITGICAIEADPYRQVEGFKLLLRSGSDVQVLRAGQWLDQGLILTIAGILGLLAMLVAAWAITLRARVNKQTNWIETKLDEERAQAAIQSGRSRVLELIGRSEGVEDVFAEISALIAAQLPHAAHVIAVEERDNTQRRQRQVVRTKGDVEDVGRLEDEISLADALPDSRSVSAESASGDWRSTIVISEVLGDTANVRALLAISKQCMMLALERHELHSKLLRQSHYDALTGLANRRLFDNSLEILLEETASNGGGAAVMVMDLDEFKAVNDHLGHAAGDSLLEELGRRFSSVVRPMDMVARVGGDEFMVALPNIYCDTEAELVAERLRTIAAAPFTVDGFVLRPSVSIGFALFPRDGRRAADLKNAADQRMYLAKASKPEHELSSRR